MTGCQCNITGLLLHFHFRYYDDLTIANISILQSRLSGRHFSEDEGIMTANMR